MDNPIDDLLQQLRQFRDERDWAQFHNAKDLALALSIEAAELNEQYLWKKPEDADPTKVREELADVLLYAFQLADKYDWDIPQLMREKIEHNAAKYPIDKAKGSARKYDQINDKPASIS
jgi:NTP pyrophosphatase (non-canonical NTP hydrolase)